MPVSDSHLIVRLFHYQQRGLFSLSFSALSGGVRTHSNTDTVLDTILRDTDAAGLDEIECSFKITKWLLQCQPRTLYPLHDP